MQEVGNAKFKPSTYWGVKTFILTGFFEIHQKLIPRRKSIHTSSNCCPDCPSVVWCTDLGISC